MKASLRVAGLASFFVAFCLVCGSVVGQGYPSKTIRFIVPFPPGGNSDRMARLIGQKLSESWDQPVLVDNRAGATGTLGSDLAAKAPPNGYTLLLGTLGSIGTSSGLYRNLPYDPIKDFAPITLIAAPPLLLVVHPSVPAKSVKELIAVAKSKPGQLNYASSGNGSSNHLFGELFRAAAGVNMVHVPYKGASPALTDVLAGHVDMMFAPLPAALPQVKAGRLTALAVSSAKRSPAVPDLPTVAEAGVPGYQATGWDGVLAPAGTPKEVIMNLNREIVRIVHTPEVKQRLASEGAEAIGSTPEEFAAFIKAEISKWAKLIKDLGVSID